MKKILLSICLIIGATAMAQNTVPTLEVEGNVMVDSCVIVQDSIIVEKDARIKGDEKIEGNLFIGNNVEAYGELKVHSDATLEKDLTVNKDVIIPNIQNESATANTKIVISDANGILKTTGIGPLVDGIYSLDCIQNQDGTYPNPTWLNAPGVIYAGAPCPPGTKVGIGTDNPSARLDVRGTGYFQDQIGSGEVADNATQVQVTTTRDNAIVVTDGNDGSDVFRVLNNGTVWATEINVDQRQDFPDYVFADDYYLMPLDQLENYIETEKHLPNIPSAEEVKKDGQNIADLQLKQMEKIEELTLYMIQMNKEIQELKKKSEKLESENDLLKQEVKELKETK